MDTVDPKVRKTVSQVVAWLVAGDYAAIERFSAGVRLPATLLREAVAAYGQEIVMPPDSELNKIDVVEVDGSNPKAWSVRVDMWAKESGRSDQSLECTLVDRLDDLLAVEIENLHVL